MAASRTGARLRRGAVWTDPGKVAIEENRMMSRRNALLAGIGLAGVAAFARNLFGRGEAQAGGEKFEVSRSEAEWKQILSPEQFRVLRQHGTERPYSSALNDEHRPGVFACAGCDLPLFRSETKFESGTGWPSFFAPIDDAVRNSNDYSLIIPRTEVHCRRCGGHLGHVFDDGPKPTGKRYCMNGVALKFEPAAGAKS
jgi:peptide-methionine (R)-S-oxide reductase